ncbi:hypothetical protein EDB92DRAFT_747054, partial [Lactarius akahatsu]
LCLPTFPPAIIFLPASQFFPKRLDQLKTRKWTGVALCQATLSEPLYSPLVIEKSPAHFMGSPPPPLPPPLVPPTLQHDAQQSGPNSGWRWQSFVRPRRGHSRTRLDSCHTRPPTGFVFHRRWQRARRASLPTFDFSPPAPYRADVQRTDRAPTDPDHG